MSTKPSHLCLPLHLKELVLVCCQKLDMQCVLIYTKHLNNVFAEWDMKLPRNGDMWTFKSNQRLVIQICSFRESIVISELLTVCMYVVRSIHPVLQIRACKKDQGSVY